MYSKMSLKLLFPWALGNHPAEMVLVGFLVQEKESVDGWKDGLTRWAHNTFFFCLCICECAKNTIKIICAILRL